MMNTLFVPYRKHFTPNWELFRLGGFKKILMVRPNTQAFGNYVIDLIVSYHVARKEDALLYFYLDPESLEAKRSTRFRINESLMKLENRFIKPIQPPSMISQTLSGLWKSKRYIQSRLTSRLSLNRDTTRGTPPRYRRLLFNETLDLNFDPTTLAHLKRLSNEIGIDLGRPIITLHIRESGLDMMDQRSEINVSEPSRRNPTAENYFPAIDHLASLGYQIVRVGDSTMTPIHHPGVFDLATHQKRSGALEAFLIKNSHFFIASDSGPYLLSYLLDTPLLQLNIAHPIANYPVRRNEIYSLKHVRDRKSDQELSLNDRLNDDFLLESQNTEKYYYRDNTPEEILSTVNEMLDVLENKKPASPSQMDWKKRSLQAALRVSSLEDQNPHYDRFKREGVLLIRKAGPENGFLGEGRIANHVFEP